MRGYRLRISPTTSVVMGTPSTSCGTEPAHQDTWFFDSKLQSPISGTTRPQLVKDCAKMALCTQAFGAVVASWAHPMRAHRLVRRYHYANARKHLAQWSEFWNFSDA